MSQRGGSLQDLFVYLVVLLGVATLIVVPSLLGFWLAGYFHLWVGFGLIIPMAIWIAVGWLYVIASPRWPIPVQKAIDRISRGFSGF